MMNGDVIIIKEILLDNSVKDKLLDWGITEDDFLDKVERALEGKYITECYDFLANDDLFHYILNVSGSVATVTEAFDASHVF